MSEQVESSGSYDADGIDQLEAIWGEGFMSPGGAGEVGRIVAGAGVADADVLDIGCGTGGAAFTLAIEHRAQSVTGVDVEPFVVDRATTLARERGQNERVRFIVVEPGPLPFADGSFDVVFSKDAIIHVQDKKALYAEACRVLRSGGRLRVSDWLRGEGDDLDPFVDTFVADSGEKFYMQTLAQLGAVVSSIGFVDVEVEDRCEWYANEAQNELARLRGPLRDHFLARFDQAFYDATVRFWERAVASTQRGVLRPGHVRARKP
ncbi:MAG TPA: methyltransferase domain-containing protein [Ilumatobacteraceae bacterium]|jgi:SAM-dependent methyltransferase|nr:methyltransferase domain-containing protein [Ilumatobacteraceae bacterium]